MISTNMILQKKTRSQEGDGDANEQPIRLLSYEMDMCIDNQKW
jgi:hypothetical protein